MIEILVIDDNPADTLLFQRFLSQYCGVGVTIAHDGEEALALLAGSQYKPNLILLDLKMPKMNGHEVLRRVRRKIAPKTPIIVMSGSRNLDDISQAYACGANAYVEKPSELDSHREIIQSMARLWIEPLLRDQQEQQSPL